MKIPVISLISFLLALNINAQIVLSTSDLPSAGDVQISIKVDSLQAVTLDPGISGENVLWDFSHLLPCCNGLQNSYDTLSWILPANTPYSSSFPLSNLAYKNDCYWIHSHVTHTDEEFCNYTYTIKDNEGVLLNGYYSNEVLIFEKMRFFFPLLKYGNTLQDDARLIYYSSNDTVRVKYFQNVSVADGWGTLITPADSSSVLRIFTTEIIYDSIYVNGIGSLNSTIDSNYYYHWYAKNLGFPVLQIVKGSLHQENKFFQAVSYAAVKTNVLGTSEHIQRNSVLVINERGIKSVTFILPQDISAIKYFVEIFDITGRRINPPITFFSNKIIASFDNFPTGIYLYRISDKSQPLQTGKIAMQ
jgi:hypothetical protein